MARLVDSNSMSEDGSQHGLGAQVEPLETSQGSLRALLLHGNLDIWVKEAKNLPNMDRFHWKWTDIFGRVGSKAGGSTYDENTSNPVVVITISNAEIGRTFVIQKCENPVWMQHFYVPVAHYGAEVHFVVRHQFSLGAEIIGVVGILVEQLFSGNKVEGTFPIMRGNGKPCKPGAVLTLSIQYLPVEKVPLYHGVGSGPCYQGVPGTYFPLRKGGKVTLYQDAHVHEGSLPNFFLDNGLQYQHGQCWHDIFNAISDAHHLVYITGWSFYHLLSLVRDNGNAKENILGDLLKAKANEGVRVLLLIWDYPTSTSILGYKTNGVMNTENKETRQFFKHSSVQVLLCPRAGGKGRSWAKKEVGIYTHHQKTVIVDADAGDCKRKIIAFIGGLDLTVGRYDTPEHPLFRTLQTVHSDDFLNPSFPSPTSGCPREPWHDLHCQIDGPAAYDILTNFEQRWLRAAKGHGIQKRRALHDDLLRLERIPGILGMVDVSSLHQDDSEGWHVQIFCSIDSNSVKGFPKDPKDATAMNLLCGRNVVIDISIHTAYVKAIRAAQHFIYIESQYFLGSSYNWNNYKDLGANNLIPMEIALKIANKIRAMERFSAYIVLPMWPEGVPTSNAVQRILFWQYNTMQMMYKVIYKALIEVWLEDTYEPQDFLNFFCLGNREAQRNAGNSSSRNSPHACAQESQRFMINVHSKGMILDDEYVILGSANINERSLAGNRDTEIAMGAYQPQYTWGREQTRPRGQIYGYRMSLWAEHLGFLEQCFEQPESLECVRRVRSLGEMNWSQYTSEEITDMKGHLLKYPLAVDRTGKVKPLPGCETFPDLGGDIIGSFRLHDP